MKAGENLELLAQLDEFETDSALGVDIPEPANPESSDYSEPNTYDPDDGVRNDSHWTPYLN